MGVDYYYCKHCEEVRVEGFIHSCRSCREFVCDDCAEGFKLLQCGTENEWVSCPKCKNKHEDCGINCSQCWIEHFECDDEECPIKKGMNKEMIDICKKIYNLEIEKLKLKDKKDDLIEKLKDVFKSKKKDRKNLKKILKENNFKHDIVKLN